MRFDPPERLRQRTRLPAKLVYDTADRSLTANARRRAPASRHLLYEVEDLCLELRIDQPKPSVAAVVAGQLTDRRDPLKPLAGLPVFLLQGEQFLARSTSNRLGEFQVEYEPQGDLSLCLVLENDHLIEVPLEP